MSNLAALNNQFEYNLPIDFVPEHIEERYMPLLKAKKKIYKSVIDYLNSNIISITEPSVNFPIVTNPQNKQRKQISWKTVGNIYDLFDDTITVTFNNVDSNLNYLIIKDILINHYLNVDQPYDQPLMVTVVDENRKALFHINYRSVIWTGISDNTFANNDQIIQNKTFTCSFTYNYIDFVYVGTDDDVITNENGFNQIN